MANWIRISYLRSSRRFSCIRNNFDNLAPLSFRSSLSLIVIESDPGGLFAITAHLRFVIRILPIISDIQI